MEWTPWDAGDQQAGGKPGETAKWVGPCINDDSHKDAALILHDDGWWSFTCFHASCAGAVNHRTFMAWAEEEQGEKYPYPGRRTDTEDPMAGWGIDDVEGEGDLPTAVPAATGKPVEPKKFNLTDAGNGERLTHRWGNVLRYCTERGWYYWSGKHWQLDKVEKVNKAALATVRRIVQDELPLHLEGIDGDDEESKKLRDKITGDVMW